MPPIIGFGAQSTPSIDDGVVPARNSGKIAPTVSWLQEGKGSTRTSTAQNNHICRMTPNVISLNGRMRTTHDKIIVPVNTHWT